ncbi:MAG TPA: DUF4349 domain-containing protein [Mycobacteriales bacterium]|nr:DUF4349 domain-containing protein [Mycobacteriales bacterium]
MPWSVLAVAAAALLALAGCSSDPSGEGSTSAGAAPAVGAGQAAGTGGGAKQAEQVRLEPRSLIRTAEITVRVDDVTAAAHRAQDYAGTGGSVAGDTRSGSGDKARADLILKVGPDRLEVVLDQLGGLGEEQQRASSTEDVTEQVADVGSRVATMRAAIARVQAILSRATRIGDVVAVEGELSRRITELESLQARQRALAGQVDLATVTLHLVARAVVKPVPPAERGGFVGGLASGWHAFTRAIGLAAHRAGHRASVRPGAGAGAAGRTVGGAPLAPDREARTRYAAGGRVRPGVRLTLVERHRHRAAEPNRLGSPSVNDGASLPSKGEVNRCGEYLAWVMFDQTGNKYVVEHDRVEHAVTVVSDFRAAHQYPLTKLTVGVRSMVKTEGADVAVSQRLKRLPRIIRKLYRMKDSNLARLEDVGGCRAVLSTGDELARVHRWLRKRWGTRSSAPGTTSRSRRTSATVQCTSSLSAMGAASRFSYALADSSPGRTRWRRPTPAWGST